MIAYLLCGVFCPILQTIKNNYVSDNVKQINRTDKNKLLGCNKNCYDNKYYSKILLCLRETDCATERKEEIVFVID